MSERPEFEHEGRVIRDEIRIEADPEAVYDAWADPDTITGWFVGRMDGRMEVGETVAWHWDDDGPGTRQRVLAAERPHRIVTELDVPQGLCVLEVTIEQEGGHSVLRLVQSGFGEGPEWDDEYDGMLSGWMVALGLLKLFLERYAGRRRREILVLTDASFDREAIVARQRTESGLQEWLSRSGAPGTEVGDPVELVLENGRRLTGTVLRQTEFETLWSWDEIEGVVEIKAFRGAAWGSKVGVRISSWIEDLTEIDGLEEWLGGAVGRLAEALARGVG